MTTPSIVENVACLGCGCTCDDIGIVVRDGRIVEARNACSLGARWFGDGRVPARCVADGRDIPLADAIMVAATMLGEAARPLVYLAPGLSCDAQREATSIADLLRARLDTVTSSTASRFILASQERGHASATFGEIRNRADVVVFWGIDLDARYPRFASRYAPDPIGMHVERGRDSRTVIAVDLGGSASTVDADRRVTVAPTEELATLTAMEALVRSPGDSRAALAALPGAAWSVARELAPVVLSAHYIALVYDAEPDERAERSPRRFDALASLSQALNGRTRCAAIALRAGGNRSGADSVLVSQAGYPFAVDFARGVPRYDPYDGSAARLLERREVDVALVIGDATSLPDDMGRALSAVRCIVIGPWASESPLGTSGVVIDAGRDGIHANGTAVRADDVPLPLRVSLAGPPAAANVARAIATAVRRLQVPGLLVTAAVGEPAAERP